MNQDFNNFTASVSFWVRHPSLKPDQISQTLGIEPSHTWEVGTPRKTPSGKLLGGINDETVWHARLGEHIPGSRLSSFMAETLLALGRNANFLQETFKTGGEVELRFGWFADSFTTGLWLSSADVDALAKISAGLGFDIYVNDNLPLQDENRPQGPKVLPKGTPPGTVWFGGPIERISLAVGVLSPDASMVIPKSATLNGDDIDHLVASLELTHALPNSNDIHDPMVWCTFHLADRNKGAIFAYDSTRLLADRGLGCGFLVAVE